MVFQSPSPRGFSLNEKIVESYAYDNDIIKFQSPSPRGFSLNETTDVTVVPAIPAEYVSIPFTAGLQS